jgi:hypothetical protein
MTQKPDTEQMVRAWLKRFNLPFRLLHKHVILNGLFVVLLASNLLLAETSDDPNLE